MADLTFSDQLAILGIVISVIVGVAIFAVQWRLSDKVNRAILDQKERDDKRKYYHLFRVKNYTENIRNGLATLKKMLDEHMKAPTPEGWNAIEVKAKMDTQLLEINWKTTEYDLSEVNDLVKEIYLVDKYEDVCIGLTKFTYDFVTGNTWSYLPSLQEARSLIEDHLQKLDQMLERINREMAT